MLDAWKGLEDIPHGLRNGTDKKGHYDIIALAIDLIVNKQAFIAS